SLTRRPPLTSLVPYTTLFRSSLRAAALQRLGRMQSVNVSDIAKLYDVADARSLRERILIALSQRKEPEAIDKMMDIARKDTDPQDRKSTRLNSSHQIISYAVF